jgi:hypothetical protein
VAPQASTGKERVPEFGADELLFRQVPNTHIEEGEVNLLAIRSLTKVTADADACTSVVRSAFTESFLDAIHPNCADGKDLSQTHSIRFVRVADLPKGLTILPMPAGPVVLRWDMFPYHAPLPLCYAHSTICSCSQTEPGVAVTPPSSVREEFRRWFAVNLEPIEALAKQAVPAAPALGSIVPLPDATNSQSRMRTLCGAISRFCKSLLARLKG